MHAKPRIILVDDHELVLEGLRLQLQEEFEVVRVLTSGETLVDECLRLQPDLVLLDLNLPRHGGLDLIGEIRARVPGTRVLVVTMFTDPVLADAAFNEGAQGFIPKDAGSVELKHAIREVLAGKQYLSPHVSRQRPQYSSAEVALGLSRLTPRQRCIMRLLAQGKSSACIAGELGVSPFTITFHRGRIRKVLGIKTEFGLIRQAMLIRMTEAARPMEPAAGAGPA